LPEGADFKGNTNISSIVLALSGYIVLFTGKLITYFFTKITVLYAEALHSLADVIITIFILIALIWSKNLLIRITDLVCLSLKCGALVAATIFISFTSIEAFREAIPKLLGNVKSEYSNLNIGIIVTLAAIIISSIPLIKILIKKEKRAAFKAQFISSLIDEIALIAALIGIIFIMKGAPIADGITSLIVAIVIALSAAFLWWDNAKALMGYFPKEDFYKKIEDIAKSVNGVISVHDMRAEFVGSEVHLDMHTEVPRGIPIEEANLISEKVHNEVEGKIKHSYCVIHVDPENINK
jgi:cation diffusion facilitator family transporter